MAVSPVLDLDVLGKFTQNISGGIVFANEVPSFPVFCGEDTVTDSHSAADLSGRLPDNLSEVERLGVARVVFVSLVHPKLHSIFEIEVVTGTSSEVLARTGVLELAFVSPGLGLGSERVGPFEGLSTMGGTSFVVRAKILPLGDLGGGHGGGAG